MSNKLLTRILGIVLVLISLPGLYFNISVFRHFLSIEKTSFYILCISKTISNSFILLVNLLYNAPCAILYTIIGSDSLNRHLSQAIRFGIYLMGPLTQTLISINRFLVVCFSPTKSPSYSNRVTVAILIVFWLSCIYFSIGFSESCYPFLVLGIFFWEQWFCEDVISEFYSDYLEKIIIFLGVLSNLLNIAVVMKLILSAKKANGLTSEASRRRHRTTVRLFIQSCIQDWLYVIDFLNAVFYPSDDSEVVVYFILGFGTLSAIHGADGFVMCMFHRKKEVSRKVSTVSVTPRASRSQLY